MKIHERLTYLRKSRNYTQRQIAKKLNMTHSGYSKYERGEREPGLEIISKLAEVYGITPGAIFVLGDKIPDIENELRLDVLLQFYELRVYEINELLYRFSNRIVEQQVEFAYDKENNISEDEFEEFKNTLKELHERVERIKKRMVDILQPISLETLLSAPEKNWNEYVEWVYSLNLEKKKSHI